MATKEIRNLIQYTYSCTNAMFNYLKDCDKGKLISELDRIEQHAKENIGGKYTALWFKFGEDDPLSTTIRDIDRELDLPTTNNNRKFLEEKFESITDLEPDKELRVYYS